MDKQQVKNRYNTQQLGQTHIVTKKFTVTYKINSLTVPKGFVTDWYSTPWHDCPDIIPAIAHDYAYKMRRWDNGKEIKRADADDMLYQLMLESQDFATRQMAFTYWIGVRIFGWWPWLLG